MRLFGMYYVCKKYISAVEDMKLESRTVNGNTIRSITGWKRKSIILNELARITPLREFVRKFYDTIPVIYCDQDKFDLSVDVANAYTVARRDLITSMKTIISMYESVNSSTCKEQINGFDVKLPQFTDIGEFSKCLEDLDFVIKHCPYLNKKDSEIKYGSVDIGSTWLTFLIAGASASIILTNLGKIVDAAIKIKSHIVTVKMQEEELHSMQVKDEIAGELLDVFKKTNQALTKKCVKELENDLGKLENGEEEDITGKSLEKLGFWMDKGMQIYSAIDAPDEVKNLFPAQEEVSFLSDDLLKLIEMKKGDK